MPLTCNFAINYRTRIWHCMNIRGTYALSPAHRLGLSSLSYTIHGIFLFTFLAEASEDDFTRTLSLFHSVYVIFGRQPRNQTVSSYLAITCCTSIFLLTLPLAMNHVKDIIDLIQLLSVIAPQ